MASNDVVPRNWDQVLASARYIMIGYTDEAAADMAGTSVGTLRKWKRSKWWVEAMREATTVEFHEMAAEALGVVKTSIKDGDVTTARWFLNKVHHILGEKASNSASQVDTSRTGMRQLQDLSDEELRALAEDEEDEDVQEAEWHE